MSTPPTPQLGHGFLYLFYPHIVSFQRWLPCPTLEIGSCAELLESCHRIVWHVAELCGRFQRLLTQRQEKVSVVKIYIFPKFVASTSFPQWLAYYEIHALCRKLATPLQLSWCKTIHTWQIFIKCQTLVETIILN